MGWWQNLGRKIFKISETPGLYAEAQENGAIFTSSPESAMRLSTVFACIRLLSETVATLPCVLYERMDHKRRVVAYGHSLYSLLHDSPNADNTSVEFWERCTADLCLRGNSYSEKIYSAGNRLVSINPLQPDLVDVWRDMTGKIRYTYADPVSGWREISEENMFHVRGFGTTNDDTKGLSPIAYASTSIDIAKSTDDVAAKTYKNGLRASAVVSTDRVLTPEQREQERAWMGKAVGGVQGSGKVLVFEGGYKIQPWSISPADAQMLENRSYSVEDICRWYRVPPFMVGHTEKSTSWGTGLEQQGQGFATYTLRPYLARIEAAVEKRLLSPSERLKYFVEFNIDGLLRADAQGRAALYASGAQNGWLLRNEIRAKENMDPIPGGDISTVQSNLIPLDQIGTQGGKSTNGNGTEKPAA